MNVLIVGAGSVGQLYGYCLQKGGAKVAFYVRPKYVEEARKGFALYPLNDRTVRGPDGPLRPVYLQGCGVLSTLEELAEQTFDQVWICIPSTGLYGGWFPDFARALGPETIMVSLTPGLNDRAYITEHFDPSRLVIGLITAIAYPAPLPGESVPEPGTAFYFPPLAAAPFEGKKEHIQTIVPVLKRGGMAAKHDDGIVKKTGFPNIVLMSFIARLELCGWSLDAVGQAEQLSKVHLAIKEGLELVSKRQGTPIPLPLQMISPLTLKFALGAATKILPFDLEVYLKVHFTKVGDQTRLSFKEYLAAADELGLEVPHLRELAAGLS